MDARCIGRGITCSHQTVGVLTVKTPNFPAWLGINRWKGFTVWAMAIRRSWYCGVQDGRRIGTMRPAARDLPTCKLSNGETNGWEFEWTREDVSTNCDLELGGRKPVGRSLDTRPIRVNRITRRVSLTSLTFCGYSKHWHGFWISLSTTSET